MSEEVTSEEITPLSADGEEAQADTQPEEEAFEEQARWQGWVDKDEFRGPKDQWIDARTFVEKGREINSILRANNDRLTRDFGSLEKQNRLYAEEIRALKEAQKGINQRDFDTTLAIKNKQRMAAMKAGNEDLFLTLDQEIVNLLLRKGELIDGKVPLKAEDNSAESPSGNVDPAFNQWVSENDWYGRDEFRTVAVNRIAEQMREHYPNLVGRAFLDAVLRNAVKRYPEDFGVSYTPGRRSIGDISVPSAVINHGKGQSERDLPQEAKAAMERFVKDGLGKKEDYLKIYFEE